MTNKIYAYAAIKQKTRCQGMNEHLKNKSEKRRQLIIKIILLSISIIKGETVQDPIKKQV
jgi:hypothetical protein